MAEATVGAIALKKRQADRRLPGIEIPNNKEPELSRTLEAMNEHFRMYEGSTNAPKERFVTLAELENSGLITTDVKNKFAFIAQVQGQDVIQPGGTSKGSVVNHITNTTVTGGGGATELAGLTDVDAGGTSGDFLYFSGTTWGPRKLFSKSNTWSATQRFSKPLRMLEQAAAPSAVASYGYLWVKDDTPNTLWFTDDAGVSSTMLRDVDDATITGSWIFTSPLTIQPDLVTPGTSTFIRYNDQADTLRWSTGCAGGSTDDFIIYDQDNGQAIFRCDDTTGDITLTGATGITGALTATSYGGITEANLLDKTAVETVSGSWGFTSSISIDTTGSQLVLGDTDDAGARYNLLERNSLAANFYYRDDAAAWFLGWKVGDAGAFTAYHNGSAKLATASTGVTVTGDLLATSHGGITEANLLDKSATETVSGNWDFSGDVDLTTGKVFTLWDITDTDSVSIWHDGTRLRIDDVSGTDSISITNMGVFLRGGVNLRIEGATSGNVVAIDHDDTDFNITGTNTTDIDIAGFTTIQAGGVNADFDAITGTSYGGITEANLVDKSATEAITGAWSFTTPLTIKSGTGASTYIHWNDALETLRWRIGCDGSATDDLLIYDEDSGLVVMRVDDTTGDISFIGATGITGALTSTSTIAGTYYEATALGPLTDPGADDAYFGGYGILGSRSSFYVSNITGAVKLNYGAGHGSGVKLETVSTGVTVTGDLLATSHGGITEANLVDKSATEDVSGAWTFSGALLKMATGAAHTLQVGDDGSGDSNAIEIGKGFNAASYLRWTRSGTADYEFEVDASERMWLHMDQGNTITGQQLRITNNGTGSSVFILDGDSGNFTATLGDVSGVTIGGITEANLVDKSAAEVITGEWSVPAVARNKTASYTMVLGDAGQLVRFTGATASKVCTIPANASVAYPIGTMIAITNDGSVDMTVAITTDTLTWGKTNGTGTRTLAAGADAVILKTTSTTWKFNGSALVT